MNYLTEYPKTVRNVENVFIPLSDGTKIAARIVMPADAEEVPVPAILEYIPYRKRDRTRHRDDQDMPYVAGHGYAYVRADIRGSGESEGVLEDEYLQQELEDGVEIINWIAQQPWCTGKVGMIGISWGGFNGLQVAALQPEPLEAVITLCSTDDRYADDVHYMGGCLLGDNLSWASVMFGRNSLPPDPEIVGEKWRDMWLQRLEGSGLWLQKWLNHQRRDDYWRHGSICEDYSDVNVPVFAVSGWADGYSNAVFRLVKNLKSPVKGLVGPWSHRNPHRGLPGPAIGFLQEVVRWFDHWLKGVDRGVEEDPLIRVYMQDSMPPFTTYDTREGRWVAEEQWPSPRIDHRRFSLGYYRIEPDDHEMEEKKLTIQSPLVLGMFAGKWCSYSAPPDLPGDQRNEDGGAIVFDSHPLEEDVEIMGAPEVELEFHVDKPVAMVAVRLSDIDPDNRATRVTYGVLNLTHRNGHENPEPLEPGKRYRVKVRMNEIAQVFPRGHLIRLSVSTSYYPLAWPPPELVHMCVYAGSSSLTLPVRPPRSEDSQLRPFEEPEAAPPMRKRQIEPGEVHWDVNRDLITDRSTLHVVKDEGTLIIEDIDLEMSSRGEEFYSVTADHPESLRGEVFWTYRFHRGDWEIQTDTHTVLTSDKDNFYITAELDAWEGETRIFSKSWDETIPRDLV